MTAASAEPAEPQADPPADDRGLFDEPVEPAARAAAMDASGDPSDDVADETQAGVSAETAGESADDTVGSPSDAPGEPAHSDDPGADLQEWVASLLPPRPAVAPGSPDLSDVPLDALRAELARRERSVAKLLREKQRLLARLDAIEHEVAALSPGPEPAQGPAPVAVPYRKPLGELTVAEALARLFELGDEFSPSDATERLLAEGFPTRAANFRQIVSQTLTRETRFKRVARGVYQRTA